MKKASSLDLAMEKEGSCWLNAPPMKRYHFNLTKGEFREEIALRYGWDPVKLPSTCECGKNFNVAHALHYMRFIKIESAHTLRLKLHRTQPTTRKAPM